MASAATVLDPWHPFTEDSKPGICDSSISNGFRVWTRTVFTTKSVVDAKSNLHEIRINVAPYHHQMYHIFDDFGVTTPGIPDGGTAYDSANYAALTGAGVLATRPVAMGFRARNTTSALTLDGSFTLTQTQFQTSDGTVSQNTIRGYFPGYTGDGNKPGVIYQAFYLPTEETHTYRSVTAAVDPEDFCICFMASSAGEQFFECEIILLSECEAFSSPLLPASPFLGDPAVWSETIANELLRVPQFCLGRNAISDDVVGSGIRLIGGKLANAAVEWAANHAEKFASKAMGAVSKWISGLLGAGATRDELRVAGAIVALGKERAAILQQWAAAHSTPDALYDYAASLLDPQSLKRADPEEALSIRSGYVYRPECKSSARSR